MAKLIFYAALTCCISTVLHPSKIFAQQKGNAGIQNEAEVGRETRELLTTAEAEMNNAFVDALNAFQPTDETRNRQLPEPDRVQQIEWQKRMLHDLRTSQKAWLAYRDSSCGSVSDFYEDGSGEPTAVASCKLEITTARTKFLRDYFAVQK